MQFKVHVTITKIYLVSNNNQLQRDEFKFLFSDCQLCPDDEFYEREVISTNRIYKLQEADPPHLVPIRELTGHMPRFHVLNTNEVRLDHSVGIRGVKYGRFRGV